MPRLHIPFELPQPLNVSRDSVQKLATDMRIATLQEQNKDSDRLPDFLSIHDAINSFGIKIEDNTAPFEIDVEVWGEQDVVFYRQSSLRPGRGQINWLYARLLGHYILHYINKPVPLPAGTGLQVPSNRSLIDKEASKEANWFAWAYLVPSRSAWEDMLARYGSQYVKDVASLEIGLVQFEALCKTYNLNTDAA